MFYTHGTEIVIVQKWIEVTEQQCINVRICPGLAAQFQFKNILDQSDKKFEQQGPIFLRCSDYSMSNYTNLNTIGLWPMNSVVCVCCISCSPIWIKSF